MRIFPSMLILVNNWILISKEVYSLGGMKGQMKYRLDILLINQDFFCMFGNANLANLARTCSDHTPLLLAYGG